MRAVFVTFVSLLAPPLPAQTDDGRLSCTSSRVGSATYTTCALPATRMYELGLASLDPQGRPIGTIARLDTLLTANGRRLLFAMNAGIYERPGVTTGLLVVPDDVGGANGRRAPAVRDRVKTTLDTSAGPPGRQPICERSNFYCAPNGVFLVTSSGLPYVWSTAQYARTYGVGRSATGVRLATQSGPLLLRNGRLARAFNPRSSSRLLRNAVCVRGDNSVLFVIADRVSMFELASTLRDRYLCVDALYLDGNVSQMYTGDGRPTAGEAFGALLYVAARHRR